MTREEWLRWRKMGIGSSDAPIIMNVSPWKTPMMLWEEKMSDEIDDEQSYITDLGNQWEPKIRALFEIREGRDFPPALMVMKEPLNNLRASLDGRNEEGNQIIEIKLSGKADWELAKAGKVPEKYYPQIQHALMVSGANFCFYLSYLYEKGDSKIDAARLATVKVFPDIPYQEQMFAKEMEFWNENVLKKKPPVASDRDYKTIRGISAQLNRFKSLKEKIDKYEAEMEQIRKEIIEACEKAKHPRLTGSGVRMSQISRVGNVNYKSIPELQGVDLEKYRGKGSVSWKLEVIDV